MPTNSLPWAMPKLPVNNSKTFTTPVEGDWVTGYFMDGQSAQTPIYDGVLPGIARGAGNPQKGFSDPRTDAQLMTSPAAPKTNTVEQDGSGTETQNQSATRNPAEVGFPSTNKLALNDLSNPPPQITERVANTVKDIIGPMAKTLGTDIAGAAQGAASALQGIVPQLESLVPKADELAASINPALKQLNASLSDAQSQLQTLLADAQKDMAAAQASVQKQLADAQKAATEAATKAQESLSKSLTTLQEESKNIASTISEKLNSLSASSISTKTPVILSNEIPEANLGAVVSAPLVSDLAPNQIPDQVPLDKIGSTLRKSLENSVSLYTDLLTNDAASLLGQLSTSTNSADLANFSAEQTAIFSNWESLSSQIESSIVDADQKNQITTTLNNYIKDFEQQIETAFSNRQNSIKSGG
jgi:predicted transcriptional regulator